MFVALVYGVSLAAQVIRLEAACQLTHRLARPVVATVRLWWGFVGLIKRCGTSIALDRNVHGCHSRQIVAIVVVNYTEQFKFQFGDSADDFDIENGLP